MTPRSSIGRFIRGGGGEGAGLGEQALVWIREAGAEAGLPVVSEIMDVRTLDLMLRHVDCL